MLGDTAVAVHPDDERYKHLIGKHVILPLVGRRIPIVADDYADPEKGTGAVKITPAHDFNDFEVGKRHDLPQISVLDAEGRIALDDNEDYLRGLPEGAASLRRGIATASIASRRARIVERLEDAGLLDKIEPHTHMVPHGDRSNVVIEPFLTDQWYVNAKTLAQPAIAAVREGGTNFVPKNWEKTYFDWMENIQPWCISRQLWWGHQIPAWYGPDGKVFVAETEEEAVSHALGYYVEQGAITAEQGREMALDRNKRAGFLTRDEDVLDTWFSSALWPFSTLGWPDETPELKRYYPTNVLVTGFDIIFFWVARMMMMGLHFMKEAPFPTVYIHALVRDEKGAKMSKSKGNVIDPLDLIDEYGADALRFTLARDGGAGPRHQAVAAARRELPQLRDQALECRRFAEMNDCVHAGGFDPAQAKETLNRWIAHETARATREVTAALEAYRFNEAAGAVYRFVWNVYCDWYLELAKPVLPGADGAAKAETRAMVAWARDEILKLLHPFMPFITEELWGVTGKRDALLALAPWPRKPCGRRRSSSPAGGCRAERSADLARMLPMSRRLHRSRRRSRDRLGDRSGHRDPLGARRDEHPAGDADAAGAGRRFGRDQGAAPRWSDVIKRLARVSDISFADRAPEGSVQLLVRGEVAALPLKGVIDLAAERARLDKEIAKADADIKRVDAKLGNANSSPTRPRRSSRRRRKSARRRWRAAKIVEALERLKKAL